MFCQLLFNIALSVALYSVIAISFSVVYSAMRLFNMAHAITITIGAYLVNTVSFILGYSIWVAIPLTVLFVVIMILAVNEWIYMPLQSKIIS